MPLSAVGRGCSMSEMLAPGSTRRTVANTKGVKYLGLPVLAVFAAIVDIGCGMRETPGLAKRISGTVLMTQPVGGIKALSLPTGRDFWVRAPRDTNCPIYSIAGPDVEGLAAYMETCEHSHRLKLISVTGSRDVEVFARGGDVEKGVMGLRAGRHLALSRTGEQIAFLSNLRGQQLSEPSALLYVGGLELWNAKEKRGVELGVNGLDAGLSWFPDGKRLAYVDLVPRGEVRPDSVAGDHFGEGLEKWARVPAVYILEMDKGVRYFLHLGWKPVVSSDGKTVLVSDFNGRWRSVETASGTSVRAKWARGWGDAVAVFDSELVLYWGSPREGLWARYTHLGSTGPRRMASLNVARLNTAEYETVIPYVESHARITAGSSSPPLRVSDVLSAWGAIR